MSTGIRSFSELPDKSFFPGPNRTIFMKLNEYAFVRVLFHPNGSAFGLGNAEPWTEELDMRVKFHELPPEEKMYINMQRYKAYRLWKRSFRGIIVKQYLRFAYEVIRHCLGLR